MSVAKILKTNSCHTVFAKKCTHTEHTVSPLQWNTVQLNLLVHRA